MAPVPVSGHISPSHVWTLHGERAGGQDGERPEKEVFTVLADYKVSGHHHTLYTDWTAYVARVLIMELISVRQKVCPVLSHLAEFII